MGVNKVNKISAIMLSYLQSINAHCEWNKNNVEPSAKAGDWKSEENQNDEPNYHPENFCVTLS